MQGTCLHKEWISTVSHLNLARKFFRCLKRGKIPDAKAVMENTWESGENPGMEVNKGQK